MAIDKKFFTDLESLLQEYAGDEERFRNTYTVTSRHPAEAFVILALRCMNFVEGRTCTPSVRRGGDDRIVMDNEVYIDFFPNVVKVNFGHQEGTDMNKKMKQYMLNLQLGKNIKKLDYTEAWFNSGFCKHCLKKANKSHPDYKHACICITCLKLRNRFLIKVIQ